MTPKVIWFVLSNVYFNRAIYFLKVNCLDYCYQSDFERKPEIILNLFQNL